jgi:cell division protein DivIC
VSAPLKLRLLPFGPLQMVLAIAALLLGLFVYAGVQTAAQHYRLSEQRREVQREIVELQGQLAELEGLREYLASDEYVEAVARSRFGLVRPGETAVVVEDRAHPEARLDGDGAPEREAGERWWEALFDR